MGRQGGILFIMLSPSRDSPRVINIPTSGADVRSLKFLEYCIASGIRTQVVTNSYGATILRGVVDLPVHILSLPDSLERIPALDVLKSYLILPFLSLGFLIRSRNQVVLGASTLPPDALTAAFGGFLSGSAWVYFHHWSHVAGFSSLIPKLLQLAMVLFLRKASAQFFVSPPNAARMQPIVGKNNVHVFENGADLEKIRAHGTKGDVDVLYLGRVAARKGSDTLIRIWEGVIRIDPSRRLTIAGAIEDTDFHRKLSRSEAANSTRILGQVSEESKFNLLASARCFVSPSLEEGWGIAVSEALSAGLPVVVFDLPAYSYAGSALTRVPRGDIEGFARAIVSARTRPEADFHMKEWAEVFAEDLRVILGDEPG